MTKVERIKNKEDYAEALRTLEILMKDDPARSSRKGKELVCLSNLIEAYEAGWSVDRKKANELVWNINEAIRFVEMGSGKPHRGVFDILKPIIETHIKDFFA